MNTKRHPKLREKMKKEISKKIASCKALKGKTILDIIEMPRFVENLAAYWNAQKADRDAIGTLNRELMKQPDGTLWTPQSEPTVEPSTIIRFFDVAKGLWRCFTCTSFIGLKEA